LREVGKEAEAGLLYTTVRPWGRDSTLESNRESPLKLLFLVTEDWYFTSHRLQLARAARDAGAEVVVMTHFTDLHATLVKEGFKVIPWQLSRRSLNALRELNAFLQVIKVYRRERPDLLHHIALKPIVYGGCAARLLGGIPSVNAIAGMGHVFTSSTWQMRTLRPVLLALLRLAFGSEKARAVFQNEENRSFLLGEGVAKLHTTDIIRGTGVNVKQFFPQPEPSGPPVVLLASRMLWEKGIGEFVEAARKLRERTVRARLVLVGKPDPENPASIKETQLRAWASSGLVEWWGHKDDMAKILAQANIVCLPSYYGEGVPRVLIEAAACGRAIVATDAPGCRDIVRNGQNGLLVPLHNSEALAHALETLICDPALRSKLGACGREIAVREFSEETVFAQMTAIYRRLLGSLWPDKNPG
jgi:glycosyltransferase involved in cell wall biosynthesis